MAKERKNTITGPMPERRKLLLMSLLLALLVILTYSKAFDNEFVDWDDFTYVVNNDLVRNTSGTDIGDIFSTPVSSNYHPLTVLSMRLNNNQCPDCPAGISPAPFIRGNIILHTFNTILVLLLAWFLTRKNLFVSFFVAALFGLHPMHVESVAWISERKDVLSSFFFLSGLIAWIFYKKEERGKKAALLVITFLLFLAACLSKATAVVFPLVLMLTGLWLTGDNEKKPVSGWIRNELQPVNLLTLLPFFIVSVFIGIMAYKLQSGENFLWVSGTKDKMPDVVNIAGSFSGWQRFQIASYGFITYLVKFFIPAGFSAIYPYPPMEEITGGSFSLLLKLSAAVFLLIAAAVAWTARREKLYLFGAGFYFLTVVLVLQFISVGIAIIADRYTYLPYIGIAFIAAVLIDRSGRKVKTPLMIISGSFIIIMMFLSSGQANVWQNTDTLWSQTIKRYPDAEIPRTARGKYYSKMSLQERNALKRKELQEKALVDFRTAIKAGSKNSDLYDGAGFIYGSRGDLKNALSCLNNALELDKKNGSAYYNRALVMGMMGRKEEAIKDYNSALLFKPQKAVEILTNRSNLYLETGKFREAITDLDYLISVDAGNFLLYFNRAVSRQATSDIQGAISDYEMALKINPADRQAAELLKKLKGKQLN